ncbi:MAG: TIGR02117 family protein [Bacteroidia bacterium]
MKKVLHKSAGYVCYTFLGIICFLLAYAALAFIMANIPCNRSFKNAEDGVEIYILSNGIHTDIVVPAKNEYADWTNEIDLNNTVSKNRSIKLIGFGWGDKGFYLDTKTWGDLKFSTAFKAMFWLGSSAMHVSTYKSLKEGEKCKKIKISIESYKKLVLYIKASFLRNTENTILCIPNQHYGSNDAFYEARGVYSLFFACNTWTNDGLKYCGVKTCIWTPFDKGILKQLPE